MCFFESAWTILSIFEFFKHSGVSGGPCFLSVISHIHFSSYKANEERPTASNIIHGEKCFSSHQNHLKQPTLGISRQQYSILFQEWWTALSWSYVLHCACWSDALLRFAHRERKSTAQLSKPIEGQKVSVWPMSFSSIST